MNKKQTELSNIRRDEVIKYIYQYSNQNNYPPSIRELAVLLSSSTSVANYYLDQLEGCGLVERTRKISRGTRLKNNGVKKAMSLLGVNQSAGCCPNCGHSISPFGELPAPPKPDKN